MESLGIPGKRLNEEVTVYAMKIFLKCSNFWVKSEDELFVKN